MGRVPSGRPLKIQVPYTAKLGAVVAEVRKKIPTMTEGKVVKLALGGMYMKEDTLVARTDPSEPLDLVLIRAGKYEEEAAILPAPVFAAPEEWLKIPHGAMFVNGVLLGNAGGLIKDYAPPRQLESY